MKPLRAEINNQRLNKSIDKVFPSLDQMVNYLSLPITYLMQKNATSKQSGTSFDDTMILVQNSASSGGKLNDVKKAEAVKRIIVFVFEAVDPSSKQTEILGHLKQLAASIVKQNSLPANGAIASQQMPAEEETKSVRGKKSRTPIRDWADTSNMIIDSTPLQFTPIPELKSPNFLPAKE